MLAEVPLAGLPFHDPAFRAVIEAVALAEFTLKLGLNS